MNNKNKKIAKNAVKIRQQKRLEGKPKKNIKNILLKRVLPLSAVAILLLGLLVVPCFADRSSSVDELKIFTALLKNVDDRGMNNNAFLALRDHLIENSSYFNYEYLLSGTIDPSYHHFIFGSLIYEGTEVLIDYQGVFSIDYSGVDSNGDPLSFSKCHDGFLTVSLNPYDSMEGAVTVILNDFDMGFEMIYHYSNVNGSYEVIFEQARVGLPDANDRYVWHVIPEDQIHLLSIAFVSLAELSNFLPNIAYLFYGSNNSIALEDFRFGYNSRHPDDPINYQNMLDTFDGYLNPRAENLAYGLLQSYYNGLGDLRFFARNALISGTSDIHYNPNFSNSISILNSMENGDYRADISLERFDFAVYTELTDSPIHTGGSENGYVRITILKSEENLSTLSVGFYSGSSPSPLISYLFNGIDSSVGTELTLTRLYVGQAWYNASDLYRVDFAFTVAPYSTPYMLPLLVDALFVDGSSKYDDFVYNPYEFALGYNNSYNLGYEDGNRYGYQNGFDEGYDKGFSQGTADSDYDIAYQKGYDNAVADIGSGDFGRNFLGSVFSAPIDALNNFTLIDWTLSNGEQVTITLGSIFGAALAVVLVVWFLKLFAGG